ncbi:MAG: hypothetical protein JSR46_11320 [Verrucomicrobia bacterium]|nr:hypothetical protein [Verrucomicrobiota bacterium]
MSIKKLIVLIAILAFAVVGYSSLTTASSYDNSPNAVLYSSKEGHFQALFPNEPRHATTDLPFRSSNETIRYDSYVTRSEDLTLYLLTTAMYPIIPDVKGSKQYLGTFLEQVMQNSPQSVLIHFQVATFQNNPALDFILLNQGTWTYGRIILAGNRVFILLCSNTNNTLVVKDFFTFAESLVIQ